MTERSKNKISVIAATSISTLLYTSCLCPFDVIKNTQIASQSRITARIAIKEIVAASGILGLWRGLLPSLITLSWANIIYYPLYETIRPVMDINLGSASPGISAMIARLTSVLLSSPMEKLKTSVQGTGSGQFSLFSSGFQGFRATVIRDLIYSGTFFSLLENTHATLKDKHYLFSRTVSCTLAAVTAVLITHPFDVVKTKLQTRNSHYYELEKNPFSALKYLCKNEGCHALTTGIWPRMGKLVLGVNIYINFYEFLKKFFDNLIAIK